MNMSDNDLFSEITRWGENLLREMLKGRNVAAVQSRTTSALDDLLGDLQTNYMDFI